MAASAATHLARIKEYEMFAEKSAQKPLIYSYYDSSSMKAHACGVEAAGRETGVYWDCGVEATENSTRFRA